MAAAGEDLEGAPAKSQRLAGDETMKGARQAGDHAQVAMTPDNSSRRNPGHVSGRGCVRLGIERTRTEVDGEADEAIRLAHHQRDIHRPVSQPGSPMWSAVVCDQTERRRTSAQRAVK